MSKHSFKIGDKVKLKTPKRWSIGNQIGTVVDIDGYVRVDWLGDTAWKNYPHLSKEIELAVIVGEQLQFSFMEGD